jgi:hypothetical protein
LIPLSCSISTISSQLSHRYLVPPRAHSRFTFPLSSQTSRRPCKNAFVTSERAYPASRHPTYIPEPPPPPYQSGSRPYPKWTTETHPWSPRRPLLSSLNQSFRESHILFLLRSACQHRLASHPSAREPTPETFYAWKRLLRE